MSSVRGIHPGWRWCLACIWRLLGPLRSTAAQCLWPGGCGVVALAERWSVIGFPNLPSSFLSLS